MSIEALSEELRQEKANLQQQLSDAKKTVTEITKQIERVDASLAALNGRKPRKRSASKKSTPKASRSAGLSAVATERVADMVVELLQHEGTLSEAQLEERVTAALGEEGQVAAGIFPALKKALESDRFESSLAGWRLAEIRLAT